MIYESKGGLEKKVNYYGVLTVSGEGEIKIPCRGSPLEVEVGFSNPTPPRPSCGPILDDTVEIEIDHLLSPFPLWAIKISWDINTGSVREIYWRAKVARG